MSFTRKQIRQRIGGVGFCNDMLASSASAVGTTTTLIDTTLKQPDDFYQFGQIVPLEGNGANASRYITDWVQSTSTFTVDRVWAGATASGDDYEVHRLFTFERKNTAINEAIRLAKWRWARRIEDTTLTMTAGTYLYALSSLVVPVSRFQGVDEVMYDSGATGTGAPYETLDKRWWEIRDSNAALYLQIKKITSPAHIMRLVYKAQPGELSSDTDVLDPDVHEFYDFVCFKATALLFEERIINDDQPDKWRALAGAMHQRADLLLSELDGSVKGQAQTDTETYNAKIQQMAQQESDK